MRALILKEIREGWNVVLFGGLLSVLVMLLYALLPVLLHDWQAGADFGDALLVMLPPALGVAAGSVLFAREKAKGTLPLLLGLPLSRGRIWGAKVIAGLVLAALAVALLVIPVWLAIPRGFEGVSLAPFALCVALWWFIGFALALLCSTLAERPFNALLVGLLGLIGLFVAAVYLVAGLGGSLLGYHSLLDMSLWGLLTAPALLLASALALWRGELLFRGRKFAIALPTALIGFAFLSALTVGVTRVATRYERSGVREISGTSLTPGAPVIALTTAGNPVSRPGQALFRSRNLVLVDTRTGKEILVERIAERDNPQAAVSRDGRYAAVIAGPAPLTWGERGESGPENLRIWDLREKRVLYRGLPQYTQSAPRISGFSSLVSVSWSPSGSWLAVAVGSDAGKWLLAMRPDGGEVMGSRLLAAEEALGLGLGHDWEASGKAIYLLDEEAKLVRWTLPKGSKETVWRPDRGPKGTSWEAGAVSVSPDGKWIAVSLQTPVHSPVRLSRLENGKLVQRVLPAPAGQVVAWRVAVVAADGSGEMVLWDDSNSPNYQMPGFTWSADSSRLYFVVPTKLMYWEAGEQEPRSVEGLPADFSRQMAAVPEANELLIWRGPRGQPVLAVGNDGRAKSLANTRVQEASRGNGLLGLDAEGRAVLYHYERPALSTLDLSTGDLKQIYP